MSFSNNTLEQAELYLDGKMTVEELKVFEKEIENNEALQNYIETNKQMRLQYSEDNWDFAKDINQNTKVEELEALFDSEETKKTKEAISKASQSYLSATSKTNKEGKTGKYKVYFTLAMAACITLLVGYFINNKSQSINEIYAYYSSWEELPSLTERGDSQNTLLYNGEKAFLAKDFESAKITFSKAVKVAEAFDANTYLYLGISQLELGEYEASLSTFNKVIKSNSLDASKGYWYSGVLYLKKGDKVKAIKTFGLIAANANYYNNNEAKNILEALK